MIVINYLFLSGMNAWGKWVMEMWYNELSNDM